jgi:Domain of unknown function (DUF4203)
MVGESFLGLACAGLIGILFGLVLAFAGYRFFLVLLPIFGFFFGLAFGAQAIQALFGQAFLATVTSWVVGFIVGLVFAVLSYLFYLFAVALIAGALGYAVVVGLVQAIGLPMGWLLWLIGVAAGIILAVVTLRFNLQKWVIIIATSVLGAGAIVGTMVLLFNPAAQFLQNPVRVALATSPFMVIVFLLVAVLGIIGQVRANRNFTLDSYDRWSTTTP